MPDLGELVYVPLKEGWKNESVLRDWLARESSMERLSEACGLNLSLHSVEYNIGGMRADIVCRNQEEEWCVIEIQINESNHDHIGKALTYASALNAKSVVWITDTFTEKHRAAVDWLNNTTKEDFRFYGVEIELYKIDESRPAPFFKLVSHPNEFADQVTQDVRVAETQELSPLRQKYQEFWSQFIHEGAKSVPNLVKTNRKPPRDPWITMPIGTSKAHLGAVLLRNEGLARSEVYIKSAQSSEIFEDLKKDKTEVEKEFGSELYWEALPTRKDCRIAVYKSFEDVLNSSGWPNVRSWFFQELDKLNSVFRHRIE